MPIIFVLAFFILVTYLYHQNLLHYIYIYSIYFPRCCARLRVQRISSYHSVNYIGLTEVWWIFSYIDLH